MITALNATVAAAVKNALREQALNPIGYLLTTIKIFAKCLRSDIEYKTVSVSSRASCKEVVSLLLSKYRMRHRDPNLFYLTMEVTVRRWSGMPVRSLLVLEDGARPAQLALCRPPGDSRFSLQMRRGGVIKVHDTVLMPGSQYKSLLVSERTLAEEVVQLLLNCYSRRENKYYYALHEVRKSPDYKDRILSPDEKPLEVKSKWPRDRQAEFVFVLRRNMSHALSLRRLSMRTGEVKRAPPAILENGKPLAMNDTMPVKGILKTSLAKSSAKDGTTSAAAEEAVIDCTGVTPKMTTINRKLKCPNKSDAQINSNSSSCSSGPTVTFCNTVSMNLCPYANGRSHSDGTLNVKAFQMGLANLDLKGSPTGSLCTVDSATNTEIKSWSNTSTQTIISSSLRKNLSEMQKDQQDTKGEVKPNHMLVPIADVSLGESQCSKSLSELPSSGHASEHIDSDVKHMCKRNCIHCFYI
ncbi:hypothetical protein SK128_017958 [Halocaridina rubra]|uniref:Ras-associating domain-containing protein n=1 Tax=Halocaridina rubra TaxID=373956 RepID=A0AAN8X6M8_HALRR